MTTTDHVMRSLRATLKTSALTDFDTQLPTAPLAKELRDRLAQLSANMVDGRVLSTSEAAALRQAIREWTTVELLPRLEKESPLQTVALLDFLARFEESFLEPERPRLVATRRARYPIPAPLASPELDVLRRLPATQCTMAPPVDCAAFARALAQDGLRLPESLISLYAACDGFDLVHAGYLPVFSLLPSIAIDVSEADARPRRAVAFHGADDVQLAVYRSWWRGWRLVYEVEYRPLADVRFDLPRLLRFAAARATAADASTLFDGPLSWDAFFRV